MDVLTCLKRVPETGAKIVLTEDHQDIDTTNLGFTMSPHEECGVEEAVQIAEDTDGSATALTLGSEEATEQVRTALAMQADEGVLLEAGETEWRPRNVAAAIADYVSDRMDDGEGFDLLLFGNESADAGNYQVGIRVAELLDLPIVTSIKRLEVGEESVTAEREVGGGSEVYELDLPAVVAVKEGLNEPRYASMRARMRARKQTVETIDVEPTHEDSGLEQIRLETPETDEGTAEILGEGPEAVPEIMRVLDELEVL